MSDEQMVDEQGRDRAVGDEKAGASWSTRTMVVAAVVAVALGAGAGAALGSAGGDASGRNGGRGGFPGGPPGQSRGQLGQGFPGQGQTPPGMGPGGGQSQMPGQTQQQVPGTSQPSQPPTDDLSPTDDGSTATT